MGTTRRTRDSGAIVHITKRPAADEQSEDLGSIFGGRSGRDSHTDVGTRHDDERPSRHSSRDRDYE